MTEESSTAGGTAQGHLPFAVANRTVNRVVALLLRSPLHGLVSDRLLLISVTGRRTGRVHTFPVAYDEAGDEGITIHVAAPGRKRWWRNLRPDGEVRLRLRGVEHTGRAVAHGDEQVGVAVEVRLHGRG